MADRVGQQLGNYQVLRVLGRGAFAEVYLGEHQYLEIPAAIKVLHVQMEQETQELFRREARMLAHLQHHHIVRVLEFGIQEQTPYLVMEYAPNGTLRTRHPRGTRLPLEQIVSYVKQLAPALDYAHQHHVIHRDVKPENMLLNAQHEVVLTDFGIAVVQQTMESLSLQHPAGTPLYMAPEQIQGKPCAASDQYALAVVVYEWLCGQPPFRGSLFEVYSQHLSQTPPSLCTRVPHLPSLVEDAVLGALTKNPQQRFTSVQDFATVLEAACFATQPLVSHVHAEPETPDPHVSFATIPASVTTPQAGEEDLSSETTQPRLLPSQQTEDEPKPEQLVTPPPVVQSQTTPKQTKPSLTQKNRERMLRKVRAFWIEGVLEHSLHGTALIALGLAEHPDAVANPWQLVLQHPETPPEPLPTGTRITQVYEAAGEELLLLGAPGSGKTTLLLELARDLLERARHDEHHPIPVVFNLSSWATKQQPLTDWLVEELNSKYQVPRPLGQAWVDANQILPLLDGLDEVAPKARTRCIETINTYRQEHGLLPLVVCSRSADYLAQTARVQLGTAVMVQPLSPQQIDAYLAREGEPLSALRAALHQDAALRELTNTPLMLSILTLTYQGMPAEDLFQRASLKDRQRQVFEHYVERMLRQQRATRRYTPEQTVHWLSWLARQMKQRNQTVFYIEHMQPDWLSGDRMRQAYDRWAVRFPAVLMGMLASLAISTLLDSLISSLSNLASFLVLYIVLGGFIGWLLGTGRTAQQPHQSSGKASRGTWSRLVAQLRAGGLIGLLLGLGVGLTYSPLLGLSVGLICGLSVGLGSIFLQTVLEKSNTTASSFQPPPRSRKPKWQHLLKSAGVKNGILVGLLLGLSVGLGFGLVGGLVGGLGFGLSVGLDFGLISGVASGLSGGLLSVLQIGKPVGISLTDELIWSWRSLGRSLLAKRHMLTTLRVMALIGLSVGMSNGLGLGLHDGLINGLIDGLISGLSLGLISGMASGLASGLSFWLLLGLFQGVSSESIEDHHRVVPNQGIRRSARNSLVLGLISTAIVGLSTVLGDGLSLGLGLGLSSELTNGLSFGLSFGLNDALSFGLSLGLSSGLIIGLSAGLLAGLLNGGLACLRHSVLRLLLWRAGSMPWNYPHFLDYAAERVLLSKVGGGYIFIHRLLLEYFASLDNTPPLDKV